MRLAVLLLLAGVGCVPAFAAKDVPVPSSCTPQVNQKLSDLIASGSKRDVDNIMVCGVATSKSRVQHGGQHGDHHVASLKVKLPTGETVSVQVVSNDDLDGPITANAGDQVFAYGQGYITHGKWVAGVHDVHCSTHRGADNGWVVVNGVKTPKTCPASR
jgi:hypothetical protein